MASSIPGIVTAKVIDVRFAFSGKISAIYKKENDRIKRGEWLASLDKKLLQTELDKELLDYEKVRSAFEKDKFLQNALDISVKNVELAKMRLDQADLVCPVDGKVIESDLAVGLNATPASQSVKVLDENSFSFQFKVSQNELGNFLTPRKAWVSFYKGKEDDVEVETTPPVIGENGKFKVSARLPYSDKILPGMEGEIILI